MSEYQKRLGERLRAIRTQQDLTLQDVEDRSDGDWKAVVVGSYERGDRAISVAKLARLADFYGVPVSELLPEPRTPEMTAASDRGPDKVAIDLTALEADHTDPSYEPLTRFAHTIQLQRGDYNGRVLTLRGDDLRALSILYGVAPDELIERLSHEGLVTTL